jgi:hypothetical protein
MKLPHVALVVLLAAAAAAAWWLSTGRDTTAPVDPTTAQSTQRAQPEAPPAPAERSPVAAPTAPAQPTAPAAATSAPSPDTAPATAPAAAPNVHLSVRSAATSEPIAAFRWRLRSPDGALVRGDGTAGRAELTLPPELAGELLVEADGFQPGSVPEFTSSAANAPPRDVELFLVPAAVATGITLLVHDTAGRPVPLLRVDAFALRPEQREIAWHLGRPLWSRKTAAADGRYVLPELAPGEYGIRVLAIDEAGEALPLLPFRRMFTLTGSNGFVEDVPLEPGCLLQLELNNAHGQPLDPAHGAVTIGLRLPGGPAEPRHWHQYRGKLLVRAEDQLPGPGPVWLAEAVPAGNWQLDVLVDGQPAVQQLLALRAGERQQERIVVQ